MCGLGSLPHAGQHRLNAVDNSAEIDAERDVPHVVGHRRQVFGEHNAGVVAQHCDRTQSGFGSVDDGPDYAEEPVPLPS